MITKKRAFGDLGEELAAKYLKSKGYIVICRNYWKPYGEIDLVASKQGIIHFIEVKTVSREIKIEGYTGNKETVSRVTGGWNPAERVDSRKLKRLERVIAAYQIERNLEMDWQLDVALVYIDEKTKKAKIEIIESAR
jgi:putative endonuclease